MMMRHSQWSNNVKMRLLGCYRDGRLKNFGALADWTAIKDRPLRSQKLPDDMMGRNMIRND